MVKNVRLFNYPTFQPTKWFLSTLAIMWYVDSEPMSNQTIMKIKTMIFFTISTILWSFLLLFATTNSWTHQNYEVTTIDLYLFNLFGLSISFSHPLFLFHYLVCLSVVSFRLFHFLSFFYVRFDILLYIILSYPFVYTIVILLVCLHNAHVCVCANVHVRSHRSQWTIDNARPAH